MAATIIHAILLLLALPAAGVAGVIAWPRVALLVMLVILLARFSYRYWDSKKN